MSLPRWWRCKIASKDEGLLEFKKGTFVFAKNGGSHLILFDGKKCVRLPKMAVTKIKLLSRLSENETAHVERYYEFKLTQASHSSPVEDPGTREVQTLDVIIPINNLFEKEAG